jgi:hypothetical protein
VHYRSDWPEVGLPTALNEQSAVSFTAPVDDHRVWVQETHVSGAVFRWVAAQSEFETKLYRFPIWSLHVEVDDADGNLLTARLDSPKLRKLVNEGAHQLSDVSPWGTAYVSAKIVRDEPLCDALRQLDYVEVEHRRVYICKVRDIVSEAPVFAHNNICFTSLAAVDPGRIPTYRQQILDICQETFGDRGHSRHFTDPVLLERLPGVSYILAAMALNFECVMPSCFLVAIDVRSDQVCGFSVVSKKPGLKGDMYSQLLSAVRQAYRGLGIYRGLSHLLPRTLSQDATLLNVTHVDNHAMQRAYQDTGRVHLADVVVLRRVCVS